MQLGDIHPDQIIQVQGPNIVPDYIKPDQFAHIHKESGEAIQDSVRARKSFNRKKGIGNQHKKTEPLHETRSNKVAFKPFMEKQKNRSGVIPTHTLLAYIGNRI